MVVRNGEGKVVYAKVLAAGRHARLKVRPPVQVWARHAGAISVSLHGHHQGPVGKPGHPATRAFHGGSAGR
ncbi:MAG: RodZ domain-containing protein [Nocardioidaceae bacterium]